MAPYHLFNCENCYQDKDISKYMIRWSICKQCYHEIMEIAFQLHYMDDAQ